MRLSSITSHAITWTLLGAASLLAGQQTALTSRVGALVTRHIESRLEAAGLRGEVVSVAMPTNAASVAADALLTITKEYVPRKAAGRQVIQVEAKSAGKPRVRLNVTTATVAIVEGWATRYPVKRGDLLDADQFFRKTIKLHSREGEIIQEAELPPKRQFSKSLKPGELLRHHHLELVPDVKSGDNVTIYFKSNSITLVSPGKARRNAQVGESLPVIAQVTGKRFVGTLVSPNVVIVEKQ